MALLLTCGQVYDEAKDIYFEQNSWEVAGGEDMFAFRFIPLQERLEERLGNAVKHVSFNLQPFHDFGFSNLTAACQLLSKWVRNGKLRTMSITLLPWANKPADIVGGLVPGVIKQRILDTLIPFLTQDGPMQKVERTLNLHREYSQQILGYDPRRTEVVLTKRRHSGHGTRAFISSLKWGVRGHLKSGKNAAHN